MLSHILHGYMETIHFVDFSSANAVKEILYLLTETFSLSFDLTCMFT